jgi:hypothetical protein
MTVYIQSLTEKPENTRKFFFVNKHNNRMLPPARYSGILNRFYVQENRPVYYGGKHDSAVLAGILIFTFTVVHVVAFLIVRIGKGVRAPLWQIVEGPYLQNNALLISLLLVGWMLGYCAVSWTIWMQFERGERLEPDDYMPVVSETGFGAGAGSGGGASMEMKRKDSATISPATIVQLPDGDYVLGSVGTGAAVGSGSAKK